MWKTFLNICTFFVNWICHPDPQKSISEDSCHILCPFTFVCKILYKRKLTKCFLSNLKKSNSEKSKSNWTKSMANLYLSLKLFDWVNTFKRGPTSTNFHSSYSVNSSMAFKEMWHAIIFRENPSADHHLIRLCFYVYTFPLCNFNIGLYYVIGL